MINFFEQLNQFLAKGIIPTVNDFTGESQSFFYQLEDLRFLKPWLENPFLTEIIFHCDREVELVHDGQRKSEQTNFPREFIDLAFKLNALKTRSDWNKKNYQVSYKYIIENIPVRITLLHKVVQNKDHKYFIRKREIRCFPLSDFSLPSLCLKNKNIIISGSTGSGKTSLLNSLIQEHYSNEHHIILEDTREITVQSPFTTHLCSTQNLERYCADAMRLSPKNLSLGEMRSYEVVPFTLLLTSGHKGFLTTIHANSALDSIERIALLYSLYSKAPVPYEQLLTLLCKNLDYLIFMENKKVSEVVQIKGHKNGRYLYENIGQIALSEAI